MTVQSPVDAAPQLHECKDLSSAEAHLDEQAAGIFKELGNVEAAIAKQKADLGADPEKLQAEVDELREETWKLDMFSQLETLKQELIARSAMEPEDQEQATEGTVKALRDTASEGTSEAQPGDDEGVSAEGDSIMSKVVKMAGGEELSDEEAAERDEREATAIVEAAAANNISVVQQLEMMEQHEEQHLDEEIARLSQQLLAPCVFACWLLSANYANSVRLRMIVNSERRVQLIKRGALELEQRKLELQKEMLEFDMHEMQSRLAYLEGLPDQEGEAEAAKDGEVAECSTASAAAEEVEGSEEAA